MGFYFTDAKDRSRFGDSSGEDDSDEDDEGSNRSADQSHDQVSFESERVYRQKLSLLSFLWFVLSLLSSFCLVKFLPG